MDEPPPSDPNRRSHERHEVTWAVDCEAADTFLYASIRNISAMGIFVLTKTPLDVGTVLTLRFTPPQTMGASFVLQGRVQWVNPLRPRGDDLNPGMGVSFINLSPDERERLVELVHTIAYLRDE
ncbi:MAG: PilZ domain-containing protein [Polyangiaceae bacterium]